MSKRGLSLSILMTCLFLLLFAAASVFTLNAHSLAASDSSSRVYNLDTGIGYNGIQEALDAPETLNGHTILVDAGVYHESIIVRKSVTLLGENPDSTVIEGDRTRTGLNIIAPNVKISGFTIRDWFNGTYLAEKASSCVISDCRIINNAYGIFVESDGNQLTRNLIAYNNYAGINIYSDCICDPVKGNIITGNEFRCNNYGIKLYNSVGSYIYQNNFINNTNQAFAHNAKDTYWSKGYPFGGNYWSDYNSTDLFSGPIHEVNGSDGIGDEEYKIDSNNVDFYPLMAPVSVFDASNWNGENHYIYISSNSTVSNFQLDVTRKKLSFNLTGPAQTPGFCRITIPNLIVQDLWQGNYTILINGESWPFKNWTDTKNTYIYITYQHSGNQIAIVPEFPSSMLLLLVMASTSFAAILASKKLLRKLHHRPIGKV